MTRRMPSGTHASGPTADGRSAFRSIRAAVRTWRNGSSTRTASTSRRPTTPPRVCASPTPSCHRQHRARGPRPVPRSRRSAAGSAQPPTLTRAIRPSGAGYRRRAMRAKPRNRKKAPRPCPCRVSVRPARPRVAGPGAPRSRPGTRSCSGPRGRQNRGGRAAQHARWLMANFAVARLRASRGDDPPKPPAWRRRSGSWPIHRKLLSFAVARMARSLPSPLPG